MYRIVGGGQAAGDAEETDNHFQRNHTADFITC